MIVHHNKKKNSSLILVSIFNYTVKPEGTEENVGYWEVSVIGKCLLREGRAGERVRYTEVRTKVNILFKIK